MVQTIVAKEKLNCNHLLGQFLDESHYDNIIDFDCNYFGPPNCGINEVSECESKLCNSCPKGIDEENVIFVLRKNFFTEKEQLDALEGLKGAAGQSQNRGMAAGPRGEKLQGREWVKDYQIEILDFLENSSASLFDSEESELNEIYKNAQDSNSTRGYVWLTSKTHKINFNFDEWVKKVFKLPKSKRKEEVIKVRGYISNTNYAMPVFSGIAGWMDRYPRIPYGRSASYTERNYDKFQLSFPLLRRLSEAFSQYLPNRFAFQKSCIEKIDSRFYVPDTVFTTITVNKTFRTAAHFDAGDLHQGFSNLTVLTNGKKYSGGMLVLPEFRVAVNVRPGDLLLINNHFGLHGNTEIKLEEEGAERYSVVCYFREGMLNLKSKEYEDARYNFIESRRLNKNHPEWRPLWNGISPGCFNDDCEEWYNYLVANELTDVMKKDQPGLYDYFNKKTFSLEDFF